MIGEAPGSPATEPPRGWRALFPAGLDPGLFAVLLALPTVLLASKKWGNTGFAVQLGFTLPGPAAPVASHLWWFGCSLVLYVAVPLLLRRLVPALRGDSVGFTLGDARFGLRATAAMLAVMVPVVLAVAHTGTFADKYPLARGATASAASFAIYEAAYASYFFAWEFLFRGFAFFPVAARLGVWPAILIQNVPFALLHAGKPTAEAFGSVLAGVALGLLAWRTRSFFWGFAVHAVVAVLMDVAAS